MKKLFTLTACAFAGAILASCGGNSSAPASNLSVSNPASNPASVSSQAPAQSSAPAAKATIKESYILGETKESALGFDIRAHHVALYDNGCYRYTVSELKYGYSMILGTSVISQFGDYVKADAVDGIAQVTLNKASEVLLNSYSLAGGFSIVLNTLNQTYPAEMPAKAQGEKPMANSKADILAAYGEGATIFVSEKNDFSFVDADGEPGAAPTKASGEVSSILGNVKGFQIVNEWNPTFKEEVIEGEYDENSQPKTKKTLSAWEATAHAVTTFEDGSYDYLSTTVKFGYSMILGTTTVNDIGKATYGSAEDGYVQVNLGTADRVLLNSYSKAGGFNIQIDTDNVTYPVEMPAKAQGEKPMANSKDDVLSAYGAPAKVFFSESNGTMSLVDPNA